MTISKVLAGLEKLADKLQETNRLINEITSVYRGKADRFEQIADALAEHRRINSSVASEATITNAIGQMMATERAVYGLASKQENILKEFRRVCKEYEKHNSQILSKYGGFGIAADSEIKLADEIKANAFEDDNFEKTINCLSQNKDAFSTMSTVCEVIKDVKPIAESLRSKHAKINDRKRMGAGSQGEKMAVERLRKKLIDAEKTLGNRVGILLGIFSEQQNKILSRLSGITEILCDKITDSGMQKVAAVSIEDPFVRISQISKNNDKMKGRKV